MDFVYAANKMVPLRLFVTPVAAVSRLKVKSEVPCQNEWMSKAVPARCCSMKCRFSRSESAITSPLSMPLLQLAWYVSFTLASASVREWVRNPQLLQAVNRASLEQIDGEQKYTVRLARKAGEEELFIADPRFSFEPGLYFSAGF